MSGYPVNKTKFIISYLSLHKVHITKQTDSVTLDLASTIAPFRRSNLTVSIRPARDARWRDVSLCIVWPFGSAPCFNNSTTMLVFPMKAATCSGVKPDSVATSTTQPCFRKSSTTLIRFFLQAMWSGAKPFCKSRVTGPFEEVVW